MSERATGVESQRLRALELANDVRRARADVKRQIAARDLSAADCLLDPPAARGCTVAEILQSQRGWGRVKCRKFLLQNDIPEQKTVRELTDRQRDHVAAELMRQQSRMATPPAAEPSGGAIAARILRRESARGLSAAAAASNGPHDRVGGVSEGDQIVEWRCGATGAGKSEVER